MSSVSLLLFQLTWVSHVDFFRGTFSCFLVVVSEENARLLPWLIFLSVQRDRSIFSNIINLNYGRPKRQNLVQNKNIDVQILENIGSRFWCFSLGFFFGTM